MFTCLFCCYTLCVFLQVFLLDQPGGNNLWFDGYDGQSVLIIDDFSGWIKYRFLLRLLDGYQVRLEVKGSHTWAAWTEVYITSNVPPEGWYERGAPPELLRRLDEIVYVAEPLPVRDLSRAATQGAGSGSGSGSGGLPPPMFDFDSDHVD